MKSVQNNAKNAPSVERYTRLEDEVPLTDAPMHKQTGAEIAVALDEVAGFKIDPAR